MNKFFLLFAILLFAASGVVAQKSFLVKDASKIYDVKVKIEACDDGVCEGKATVYLTKKNQAQIFQTIEMQEMRLSFSSETSLDADVIEMKDDKIYGFGFVDYNFDGVEDLSLSTGPYAPYGGTSSDVFLYTKKTGKFVRHAGLSELETENMSVELNKKQKTIEAFTRSGCCFHETTRYKFVGNRLVKIYVHIEEWMDSGKVKITTETLVGKKWRRKTKITRAKG